MNRLTAKGSKTATYHNQHAYKQQINTCWCLILTAVAVFCLFCIYSIDYKGRHQDVVHIVTDITSSLQNSTLTSLLNSTQKFGKELGQDLAQTAIIVHFQQYNFTQGMTFIWNSILGIVNKLIQKVRSNFGASVSTENIPSKEEPVASNHQQNSLTVKEQKSCEVQGQEGSCPKKSEQASQSKPQKEELTSKSQEPKLENIPQDEGKQGQIPQEPFNIKPDVIV